MFDEETVDRALGTANEEAGKVLLARQSVMAKLIPDVSSISRLILRQQWHPYRKYQDADGNWGLELQVESDWLVRIAMRDDETYVALRGIGAEALQQEITSTSLLTSLINHAVFGPEKP